MTATRIRLTSPDGRRAVEAVAIGHPIVISVSAYELTQTRTGAFDWRSAMVFRTVLADVRDGGAFAGWVPDEGGPTLIDFILAVARGEKDPTEAS